MVSKARNSGKSAVEESRTNGEGLQFEPVFCPKECEDPYSTKEWEERTASIKGENGEIVFEQKNCKMPKDWSQLATNVVVSKYFYGELGKEERESSVAQLIDRVTGTIADWGLEDGYFASPKDRDVFYHDLAWMCLHQYGAFN